MSSRFTMDPSWRLILNDLGVSPAKVLMRAKQPADLFTSKHHKIDAPTYFHIWECMCAEGNDPEFPFLFANAAVNRMFTPPILAAMSSPNLTVAFRRIGKYKRMAAPFRLQIHEYDNHLQAYWEAFDPLCPTPISFTILELACLLELARSGTQKPISPIRITTMHPVSEQVAAIFSKRFGGTPEISINNSISISRTDADIPFTTWNPALWSFMEPELRRKLDEIDTSVKTSQRVRALLLSGLASGATSREDIAEKLTMSERSLSRKLREENTSFRQLIAEVRETMARQYLGETDFSVAEIAFLLGYDDTNSFYRAFRDWTGQTPETLRACIT